MEYVEGDYLQLGRCVCHCCTLVLLLWTALISFFVGGLFIALFATIWFPLFLGAMITFGVIIVVGVAVLHYWISLADSGRKAGDEESQVNSNLNVASDQPESSAAPTDTLLRETDAIPSTSGQHLHSWGNTSKPQSLGTLVRSRTRFQTEEVSLPTSSRFGYQEDQYSPPESPIPKHIIDDISLSVLERVNRAKSLASDDKCEIEKSVD